MAHFTLNSPDLSDGAAIPSHFEFDGFGCSGRNESPALAWQGAPEGTLSFAITVHDPDAPTQSGWWHWLVVDLPADTTELKANSGAAKNGGEADKLLPAGARQIRNDFGAMGWGGVCPPPGDKAHRYVFTVHALKVDKLDIPDDATGGLASYMINANALGKASFTSTYGRPK